MRTLNSNLRKSDSVDVFNAFRGESLTEMEMNFIRGGGDPPAPEPPPPIFWPKP